MVPPGDNPVKHMAITMPFGRHKGVPVDCLPDDYLEWLVEEVDFTNAALERAVRSEFERRTRNANARETAEQPVGEWEAAIVKAGIRSLTMKNHPDQGGSTEAMTAINLAAERLWERLGGRP